MVADTPRTQTRGLKRRKRRVTVHGTWYSANSGQTNAQAPSSAVQQAFHGEGCVCVDTVEKDDLSPIAALTRTQAAANLWPNPTLPKPARSVISH